MSTISQTGITNGSTIDSDHVLRIIKALSGTANNDIIISGSLTNSGSFSTVGSSSLKGPTIVSGNLMVSGSILNNNNPIAVLNSTNNITSDTDFVLNNNTGNSTINIQTFQGDGLYIVGNSLGDGVITFNGGSRLGIGATILIDPYNYQGLGSSSFLFQDNGITSLSRKGMEYYGDYSTGILANNRSIPDIGIIKNGAYTFTNKSFSGSTNFTGSIISSGSFRHIGTASLAGLINVTGSLNLSSSRIFISGTQYTPSNIPDITLDNVLLDIKDGLTITSSRNNFNLILNQDEGETRIRYSDGILSSNEIRLNGFGSYWRSKGGIDYNVNDWLGGISFSNGGGLTLEAFSSAPTGTIGMSMEFNSGGSLQGEIIINDFKTTKTGLKYYETGYPSNDTSLTDIFYVAKTKKTYTAKQMFTINNEAGINIGTGSTNPITSSTGDLWYNTNTNQILFRSASSNLALLTMNGTISQSSTINNITRIISNSFTVPNQVLRVIVDPTASLANCNITLPSNPVDGDILKIHFGGIISASSTVVTTLQILASGSHTIYQKSTPTTAVGGDVLIYNFSLYDSRWRREQ